MDIPPLKTACRTHGWLPWWRQRSMPLPECDIPPHSPLGGRVDRSHLLFPCRSLYGDGSMGLANPPQTIDCREQRSSVLWRAGVVRRRHGEITTDRPVTGRGGWRLPGVPGAGRWKVDFGAVALLRRIRDEAASSTIRQGACWGVGCQARGMSVPELQLSHTRHSHLLKNGSRGFHIVLVRLACGRRSSLAEIRYVKK